MKGGKAKLPIWQSDEAVEEHRGRGLLERQIAEIRHPHVCPPYLRSVSLPHTPLVSREGQLCTVDEDDTDAPYIVHVEVLITEHPGECRARMLPPGLPVRYASFVREISASVTAARRVATKASLFGMPAGTNTHTHTHTPRVQPHPLSLFTSHMPSPLLSPPLLDSSKQIHRRNSAWRTPAHTASSCGSAPTGRRMARPACTSRGSSTTPASTAA